MTQMIRLFAAASTQPSQHLLPTRMVEQIVSTQDKQSSRNTSESICSFIWVIFLRIDLQVCIRGYDGVTFVTLRPSVFAIPGNTRARDWRTFQPDASFNLPKRARPNYWRNIPITVKILLQNRGGANRRRKLVLSPSMRMPVYVKREFAILMLFLLLSFLKPTFLS
jgi:hypothetical protein